jgi:two-component system phosphate regulon response regulator PhoB
MTNVLVVDDEEDILELVSCNLEREGFRVDRARSGSEALRSIRQTSPDLLVLDVMLPDLPGTAVLRSIRMDHATQRLPVILLTAKTEEIDRVVGFELGADDYVTKPFSPRELMLRLRAVLRRAGQDGPSEPGNPPESPLRHGMLELSRSRHQCSVGGEPIDLTVKEFALLHTLMERPGHVFSRERLLARVWGNDVHVTPRTIDVHMKRLRDKLGQSGSGIVTVRGVGYRLEEAQASGGA